MVQRTLPLLAGAGLIAALTSTACTTADAQASSSVERGKYLVTIGVCNDCHTPLKMGPKGPEPDMSRMLSGHPSSFEVKAAPTSPSPDWMLMGAATGTAFAGPWGVSFTANLTPDDNTGIGIWTEDIFMKTLRTGKHWGTSRDILPPMPWPFYSKMTDEDLKAIFAYLRTIPPVRNQVPEPLPPAPLPAGAPVPPPTTTH